MTFLSYVNTCYQFNLNLLRHALKSEKHESFSRPYWRCYYSNTDAIIYVVDSADRDRIGISKQELVSMLEVRFDLFSFSFCRY